MHVFVNMCVNMCVCVRVCVCISLEGAAFDILDPFNRVLLWTGHIY